MPTYIHVVGALLCAWLATCFDLNDPRTRLESYIRISASTVANTTTITYINGTVFGKLPGQPLKHLFHLEGYNIANKQPYQDGYRSLSREILVYRDLRTGRILRAYVNPFTTMATEVFPINNDPVNGNLQYTYPFNVHVSPRDRVTFNIDIMLQYPNALDPQNYTNYSAGPIYQADELFQYYAKYSQLANTDDPSIPFTSTWCRRSQWLPWLEMGPRPGNLYYMSANWKVLNGLDGVAPDILDLVRREFPQYEYPPDRLETPNNTSWTVFKAVLDQRRSAGLPDIIVPQVNVSDGLPERPNTLDQRVKDALLARHQVSFGFEGRVLSEVTGNRSINMFNVKGQVTCQFSPAAHGLDIHLDLQADFIDPASREVIKTYLNPFTSQTVQVPHVMSKFTLPVNLTSGFVFSMPVPGQDEVSILGADSSSRMDGEKEEWEVNVIGLFLPQSGNTAMYGSLSRFNSWLPWLLMGDVKGLLVTRVSLYELEEGPTGSAHAHSGTSAVIVVVVVGVLSSWL